MSPTATLALLGTLLATAAGAATGTSILEVRLQDASTDPSITHMRILLDHSTIQAGRVTLHASNQSRNTVHEMIVVRDEGGRPLPLTADHTKVDEDKIHSLGEVPELDPGKSGTLTLRLTPGKYLLICNQPGHTMDGMVTGLTVTR